MTPNTRAFRDNEVSDRIEKNFRIVNAHLKKAHQSNELATGLYQQGLAKDAQQQSRLTEVFICNALHHVSQHFKNTEL